MICYEHYTNRAIYSNLLKITEIVIDAKREKNKNVEK